MIIYFPYGHCLFFSSFRFAFSWNSLEEVWKKTWKEATLVRLQSEGEQNIRSVLIGLNTFGVSKHMSFYFMHRIYANMAAAFIPTLALSCFLSFSFLSVALFPLSSLLSLLSRYHTYTHSLSLLSRTRTLTRTISCNIFSRTVVEQRIGRHFIRSAKTRR